MSNEILNALLRESNVFSKQNSHDNDESYEKDVVKYHRVSRHACQAAKTTQAMFNGGKASLCS